MKKMTILFLALIILVASYYSFRDSHSLTHSTVQTRKEITSHTINKGVKESSKSVTNESKEATMSLPQTNDKAIETVFYDIYDASTGSIHLHPLYQATQTNRFSELVELLTFDSDESIEFSTRMQQVTQDTLLDDSVGFVDGMGCYQKLCLAEITTLKKLNEEQTISIQNNIGMRNLVVNSKENNGEYIYQFAFTSDNNASVILNSLTKD